MNQKERDTSTERQREKERGGDVMGLREWKWQRKGVRKIAQMREKVEEKAAICLEKTGERGKQRERKDSHKRDITTKLLDWDKIHKCFHKLQS